LPVIKVIARNKYTLPAVFIIISLLVISGIIHLPAGPSDDKDSTVNLGGEFRILTTEPSYSSRSEVFSNNIANNDIDKAVYQRNKSTEEELGISIRQAYITDPVKTLTNYTLAENASADIVIMELSGAFSGVIASSTPILLDLSSNIDLDADWYNSDCIKDLSIKNRVYAVTGSCLYSNNDALYVVAYDEAVEAKLLESHVIDKTLCQTVTDGTWTLELFEMLSRHALDMGYSQSELPERSAFALCVASGARSFKKIQDDTPKLVVTDTEFKDIFAAIHGTAQRISLPLDAEISNDSSEEKYPAFKIMTLGEFIESDLDGWGVLPMPKRSSEQSSYISPVDMSRSRAAGVLTISSDPELAFAVLDTLFRKSSELVTPAYHNSINNIDDNFDTLCPYITSNQAFDIGDMFGWGDISGALDEIIAKEDMSTYEKALAERSAAAEFSMSVMLSRLDDISNNQD
jgi:hypothetical protein